MITITRAGCAGLLVVLLGFAGCRSGEATRAVGTAVDPPARLAFAVPGRSNSAPSVAAFGQKVAVVWSASRDSGSDVYLSASSDGGATFSAPLRVNDVEGDARASGEQPARVVVDNKTIHVAWPSKRDGRSVIRYSSSTDGGKSFVQAVSIAGSDSPGLRGWESMALAYDGGVQVVWLDGRNAGTGESHHQHGKAPGSGHMESPRQDILHASWKGDGPRTERTIATNVCFCCKTAIVTAGDRVYAAWRHIYPGSLRDIAFARSTDNGQTFGEPIRVSEDGWKIEACPDDGPALAADGHGGVHITWPALVSGDTPRKGIFYSSFKDEQSFTPRVRLDSGEGDAAHPQIAATFHTTTAVVWDERAGGARRIVLRTVKDDAPAAPQIFEGQGVSYPVIASGEGYWIVLWSAEGQDGHAVIEGRRIPASSEP
jgi:hypothetical protein